MPDESSPRKIPLIFYRTAARVLLCRYLEHLVALHGFIKKRGPRRTRIWQ